MDVSLRFLLLLVLCASVAAAQADFSPPEQLASQPPEDPMDVIDAAAVRFGVELEEQASPALRKWARAFAKKEMRKRVVDYAAVRAAVAARYPNRSEAARSAGAYLVLYTAYKWQYNDAAKLGRMLGIRRGGLETNAASGVGNSRDRNTGPTVSSSGQLTPAQGNPARGNGYLFSTDLHPTGRMFEPVNLNTTPIQEDLRRKRTQVGAYGRLLSEEYNQLGDLPPDVIREIR